MMNVDTALTIMATLDQAEDLLRHIHLRDGGGGHEDLARNRQLLEQARRRLDRAHEMEGGVDGMPAFAPA